MEALITRLLVREGWDRYTNHPADRGGPTKWGITQQAWADYLRHPVTPADVQGITEAQARNFYADVYFRRPRLDRLEHPLLQEFLFDAAVNHGVTRAVKWLQRAAGVAQDGVLGPISFAAIEAAGPYSLFLRVSAYRAKLYGRLVSGDPTLKKAKAAGFRLQAENSAGWSNRLAEFLLAAADIDGVSGRW